MNRSSKSVSLRPILIAAACGVLYGINIGLGSNCKGIFFSAIAEEFGVKLSTVTQYLTFYGITIGNWFPKRKGSILGIVVMAAGAVGMLFNPIIQRWIDLYGWRTASHTVGILMLTTGLIAAAALNKAPARMHDNARQVGNVSEKEV